MKNKCATFCDTTDTKFYIRKPQKHIIKPHNTGEFQNKLSLQKIPTPTDCECHTASSNVIVANMSNAQKNHYKTRFDKLLSQWINHKSQPKFKKGTKSAKKKLLHCKTLTLTLQNRKNKPQIKNLWLRPLQFYNSQNSLV